MDILYKLLTLILYAAAFMLTGLLVIGTTIELICKRLLTALGEELQRIEQRKKL